jgi:hypothetical protein
MLGPLVVAVVVAVVAVALIPLTAKVMPPQWAVVAAGVAPLMQPTLLVVPPVRAATLALQMPVARGLFLLLAVAALGQPKAASLTEAPAALVVGGAVLGRAAIAGQAKLTTMLVAAGVVEDTQYPVTATSLG